MRIIDWGGKMKSFEITEGGRMTIQRVIQVSLILVLVWQIWFLHIRMGVGWGQQKKRERAKQRKGSKWKKKPGMVHFTPFEGTGTFTNS
jgi:hypothetical protein